MAGRWEPPSTVLFPSTLLGLLDMGAPFSLGSQLLRGHPHSHVHGSRPQWLPWVPWKGSGRRRSVLQGGHGDTQGGRLGREGDSWRKPGDGRAGVQGFCGVSLPRRHRGMGSLF